MTVLLKDALKPNLIQTLEGQPCLMHCGPFANIAHGNSSLVADLIGQKLGDYVITESGFGSDMGMEKFFDIVCRKGGITPSAVVLVATVRALKHHGGLEDDPRADAEGGAGRGGEGRGEPAPPPGDREDVRAAVRGGGEPPAGRHRRGGRRSSRSWRWTPARSEPSRTTASQRAARAWPTWPRRWPTPCEQPNEFQMIYDDDDSIEEKIRKVATKVYGAKDVVFYLDAQKKIRQYNDDGLDKLPICMAKTHLSLSADPTLLNAPDGLRVPGARHPGVHGSRLAGAAGRRHPADAGPRQDAGGAERGHRRGRSERSGSSEPRIGSRMATSTRTKAVTGRHSGGGAAGVAGDGPPPPGRAAAAGAGALSAPGHLARHAAHSAAAPGGHRRNRAPAGERDVRRPSASRRRWTKAWRSWSATARWRATEA